MHVTVYLICALVTALMAAYGIWRTIRIAHLGTTSKLAVTAFFALAGASHFAFLDMTDLFERAFIVDTLPVTGLFVSFAYWFFLLALARDVIGGVRGLVRRKMGLPVEKRDLFTIVSTCFVAVFGIFFGITSTWNALSEPTVEPMTVAVRNLPPELEGFKVAQITDLHASNLFPAARTEAVVKAVNEARPDLVLITGDFSDGPLDREAAVLQRDADLAPLSGLKAAYGIFGVTGNHEYIRPEREKLLEIIRRHGVVILENEAVSIAVKGRRVTVAGVDDLAAERTGAGRHDLAGTLSNLADDDLRILMDHQPRTAPEAANPAWKVDLQLSGHTHGGHTGPVAILASLANNGFVKGFYELGGMKLYVSQGAGFWAGFPVRSGTFNEIRIAHLGTTSKLAVTAFFALAGASHFAFLDMTDLFERAFIVDTLPVTGLFVSFAYWFFLLALARDVIGGVRGLVRRKMGLPVEKRDLFTIVSTCFVAVFGIFFGITSTWNALSEPTVEPMTVAVRNLPPELEGFKVAQITDLHASNLFPAARTEAVVKAVNEARPDLVLITGDFSDGPLDREAAVLQRDADLAPLSGLKAAYGIFGVTGNHEYIRPEREKLLEIIRRHGVVILENEAVSIAVKGRRVTVAGVDDLAAERTGAGRHDLAGTLSNLADDDLRILMDHQPRTAPEAANPAWKVDLQLSGHTHGGHTGPVAILASLANNGFVKGFYELGGMKLYVSQGAGFWAGFPVRSGTFNEIPLITFTRAN